MVQTRWNSLPIDQCEGMNINIVLLKNLINCFFELGIKNYIVSVVIKSSSSESTSKAEKIFLNKLNLLLVQVKC